MIETKLKRRWFRFSLQTLFALVTLLAIWLGWQLSIVQERKAAMTRIIESGGIAADVDNEFMAQLTYDFSPVRRLFGDRSLNIVILPSSFESKQAVYQRIFPEAAVFVDAPSSTGVPLKALIRQSGPRGPF